MARPRIPVGSHGTINTKTLSPGVVRARTRYRFPSGQAKQVERFSTSAAKAVAALRSALLELQQLNGAALDRHTSIEALAERWLQSRADLGRAAQSVETYGYAVSAHIIPKIGDLRVAEITVERLQAYLSEVERERGHGAAKNSRSALSGMLGLATRNGLIERNPVRELEQISTRGKRRASKAIPLDELPTFYRAIRTDRYLREQDLVQLIEFMLATGWRVAEACALDISSVDFVENTASVDAVNIRVKGSGIVRQEHAKTAASARTTPLPQEVIDMLARRHRRLGEFTTLLFPTPEMRPRDPSNVQRRIRERRRELGCPELSTHSFRKTAASVLERAGLTATQIAEYLGHENPSLTQDVYLNTLQDGAASRDAMGAHLKALKVRGFSQS